MELKNFQVDGDGISLNWQGHNLDLHNCYDFQSIQYDLALCQIKITWLRSPEAWAANTVLPGILLIFSSIAFFCVKERDPAYPFTEDNCLASVCFHPTGSRGEFDSSSLSSSATDDLTFYFQSEWGFKINAEVAELLPLATAQA